MSEVDGILKVLGSMDCGSSSCLFAKAKQGMRTNGGCQCLERTPFALRVEIIKIWNKYV